MAGTSLDDPLLNDDEDDVREVLGGLRFASCPRWSPVTCRLYVSDVAAGKVLSCSTDGSDKREELTAPGGGAGCAGIGCSPHGALMVANGMGMGTYADPLVSREDGTMEWRGPRGVLSVPAYQLDVGDRARVIGRLASVIPGHVTVAAVGPDKIDVKTENGTVFACTRAQLEPVNVASRPFRASLLTDLAPHITENELPYDACADVNGNFYVAAQALMDEGEPDTPLLLIRPNGSVEPSGADSMAFASGPIVTPDGRTLVVAETKGNCITAFDRDPSSGKLSNKRVWAALPQISPIGLCLDAEGCVWVGVDFSIRRAPMIGEDLSRPNCCEACCFLCCYYVCCMRPQWNAMLRIAEGGKLLDVVPLDKERGVACVLGGPQFSTLFIAANKNSLRDDKCSPGNGRVLAVEVDVPAAQVMVEPRYCAGYCA